MTDADRARREQVRLRAAAMFADGLPAPQVAVRLRVSRKSAYAWQQTWRAGGTEALRSSGPASRCRLDDEQLARLDDELDRGPAVHGWTVDQRWTLSRVALLIEDLFGQSYTLTGVAKLLHRLGYSAQRPTQRAVERDERAVATWQRDGWPRVKERPRPAVPGSVSSTRPASR
ncbi:winged helix-turn-helix domain-containing protein [Pseudofrankia sp. BMG5.37]|uniref:winged helix-turn-helix domain-containing protein n=1 Tax=Pseudofrankia sp. BMG5.37 TaxID=3050035 RepID=UPI0028950E25|nr:winged helix-turn-helix domain-containing protein [Pseudofrankia sp. BMG5.37]MDT3447041.1 winged helix-turn-helix domain-containing protein [Pseudofrankia sp. BMG5.37]